MLVAKALLLRRFDTTVARIATLPRMAMKTLKKYFSDVSGEEIGDESPTISFAIEGTTYEVDLTESEKQSLRDALAPFASVARKSSRGTTRKKSSTGGPAPKDIRDWARDNNIDVPARGRIPLSVIEAFEKSH
jgi:hypothetical protein